MGKTYKDRHARQKIMQQIADEAGWSCHYCGCLLASVDAVNLHYRRVYNDDGGPAYWISDLPRYYSWPTLDHKVPQAAGGRHTISNFVLCCKLCNAKKGARFSYQEFFERMRDVRESSNILWF